MTTRPRTVALSTASMLLLGASTPAFGVAEATEAAVLPVDGVFALDGRGYGHGRGMSQWGAEGAASRGVSYKKILSTYYPGTSLVTESASTRIRVLVTDDVDTDLRVRPGAGLTVVVASTSKELPTKLADAKVTAWRVHVVEGKLRMEGYSGAGPGGEWHTYKVGGHSTHSGPVRLRADDGFRLVLPSGEQRDYRGEAWAYLDPKAPKGLRVVNRVRMESYLRSVVPSESFPTWRPAALQAQAVAARTYALWRGSNVPLGSYADICDTTACQVYHGRRKLDAAGKVTREWEATSTDAAVKATEGRRLEYQSKPALTEFSASNGGYSTDGRKPYLPVRADEWDGAVENSAHEWTATLKTTTVAEKWPAAGEVTALQVTSRDGKGAWGGRVLRVSIVGATSTVTVSGRAFASAMNLKHIWWRGTAAEDVAAAAAEARGIEAGGEGVRDTAPEEALAGTPDVLGGPVPGDETGDPAAPPGGF